MGGSTTQPTQTTTPNLDPRANQLFDLALPGFQQFAATTPTRYPGEQVAGFTPNQTQAQSMLTGTAAPAQQALVDQATKTNNFYTSGDIWNPASNPNLQGAIDAATRPITRDLTESVLPNLRSDAISTGNFGSSGSGIAQGLASGRASQAVGDTASKLAENEYNTNVQAQLQALGMLPMLQQAQTVPASTVGAVGDVQQNMDQAHINEAMGNYAFDQYAPFLKSQELASLAGTFPTGSTTTANNPTPNPWIQALGGAATGGSLGSLFGVPGTAVGAAGGATLPFIFKTT